MKYKNKKMTNISAATAMMNGIMAADGIKGKAKAGKAGKYFEYMVGMLQNVGFEIFHKKDERPSIMPDRYIECNVPYEGVVGKFVRQYGVTRRTPGPRTEFVLVANRINKTTEFPDVEYGEENRIRIECKWQSGRGTADSKLAFTVLDLRYGTPEKNVILLIDGEGFDKMKVAYIKDRCENNLLVDMGQEYHPKKIMKVMNWDEFLDWCGRAFITE